MKIIEDLEHFENDGLILTIGFFDGVHAGHRYLINQMNEIAKRKNLKSAILTFWPHPRLVLDEEYKPRLLNNIEEKQELLSKLPLDYCIQIPFTKELSNYFAYDFMKQFLKEKLNVKYLLVGYDHRFGKNREEGFDDYCRYGKELDIKVSQSEPYMEDGYTISSSFIRNLLNVGDVKLASKYLGYNFRIKGTVVEGYKLGRKLGYPTANIHLNFGNKCVPNVGVYAVKAKLEGKVYEGMLYIGNRPTIANGDDPSIEVNMFNFDQEIYGKTLEVVFIDRIRKQEKFTDTESLKKQIGLDKEQTKNVLLEYGI
ncbi:MAG: riboflavin biosynthesis protein RibF [Paludibacteraceae bacterium]|nr:riboflavin biosynthesis protein RibF [Paludibacteraceae bacterium]